MQGPDAGETSGGCENNRVQNNISYASKGYNFDANAGWRTRARTVPGMSIRTMLSSAGW